MFEEVFLLAWPSSPQNVKPPTSQDCRGQAKKLVSLSDERSQPFWCRDRNPKLGRRPSGFSGGRPCEIQPDFGDVQPTQQSVWVCPRLGLPPPAGRGWARARLQGLDMTDRGKDAWLLLLGLGMVIPEFQYGEVQHCIKA